VRAVDQGTIERLTDDASDRSESRRRGDEMDLHRAMLLLTSTCFVTFDVAF
jgi:hypothetical protein